MFDKFKYKVWKHLTKRIIKDTKERALILECQRRDVEKELKKREPSVDIVREDQISNVPPKCVISVKGTFYSGSSAIIGFLREFDNVRMVGYNDPKWSKCNVNGPQTECCFFTYSGFLEMVEAFYQDSPEVADQRIKCFIAACNEAYKNQRVYVKENMPLLYGEKFNQLTHQLLMSILELDESTREFLKNRQFPCVTWEIENSWYDKCNFGVGVGKKQYIFYRFAKLSPERFEEVIADFLDSFFSLLGGCEYTAYDQLLWGDKLLIINKYMRIPIKQICVVRDPRDQWLSGFRREVDLPPRVPAEIREHKLSRLGCIPADYPHELVVRFEDLVLRYDETTKAIKEFIGLKDENHVLPKGVFDPAISVANIGAWRSYENQEFMKQIENEMPEWCFYPENENLTPESIDLLQNSGNWQGYPLV